MINVIGEDEEDSKFELPGGGDWEHDEHRACTARRDGCECGVDECMSTGGCKEETRMPRR